MTNLEQWKNELRAELAAPEQSGVAPSPSIVSAVHHAATQRLCARQRQQVALLALALAAVITFGLTRWANAERTQTEALILITPGVVWIP
jgi:hypothetical protein